MIEPQSEVDPDIKYRAYLESGRAARAEMERRGMTDLDDHDVQCIADSVAGGVVASCRRSIFADSSTSGEHSPVLWCSRTADEFLAEVRRPTLYVDRETLLEAAATYVENEWLRSEWLDWEIANKIIYVECLAYANKVTDVVVPFSVRVAQESSGKYSLALAYGWRFLLLLSKWSVWFLILLFVGSFGAVWFLLTAVWLGYKYWFRWRWKRLIPAMFRVYLVVHRPKFSWRVLADELQRTRAQGVIWDQALYRLVEARLG